MSETSDIGPEPEDREPEEAATLESENPQEAADFTRERMSGSMNETSDRGGEAAVEEAGPLASESPQQAAQNEAKKRQEQGDDMGDKEIKEERISKQQVEKSRRRVITLLNDGTENITSIQTAVRANESRRRTELRESQRLRVERIESEAKSSLDKFEEINTKWMGAEGKEIPQDVEQILKSQKNLCAQLLEDKNKLIDDLQEELEASDDRFEKDLKQQADEVDLLLVKMEEQVKTMMRTYREELDQMENTYEEERQNLLTGNKTEWEESMEERQLKEQSDLKERMEKLEEFEGLLQKLREHSAEENITLKLKLDTHLQALEERQKQMDNQYQQNQEELDMQRKLLKKQAEENTITKIMQKQNITKVRDELNKLKKEEKDSQDEIQRLTRCHERSMKECKEIEKRKRHFATISATRFEDMWMLSEAEVKELVEQALDIDKQIHEQVLGLAWERPPGAFVERPGPAGTRERNFAQRNTSVEEELVVSSESHVEVEESESKVSIPMVKRLLEVLCDEVDTNFETLFIENVDDVYRLAELFINYIQQQQEQAEGASESAEEADSILTIHPNEVLAVLKVFTAQYKEARAPQRFQSLVDWDDFDDAAYWNSLANVIPESKLKVWDALENGLNKYYEVLRERAKLITSTQNLKRNNAELRMLLNQRQAVQSSPIPQVVKLTPTPK